MAVEIGTILEGKVTGLTKFGAFVQLPGGETGMVHISEVSSSYIESISEHLSENQEVTVKVIAINESGKIGLSIKQAMPQAERPARKPFNKDRERSPRKNNVWQGQKSEPDSTKQTFEEMMSSFKKSSDDRMSGIKKTGEPKRNNRRGS